MTLADHRRWMNLALALARQSLPWEVPVGCVIVYRDQLIASAFNRREVEQCPSGHAEVIAVNQAARQLRSWRLAGCTVYVTLEPCPMCAGLLAQARVSLVVYGADDPQQGACGSRHRLWRGDTIAGVEAAACHDLLRTFFQKTRQAWSET